MYFPYFRGKQYEVLAVRESTFLPASIIVPVFEPTSLSTLQANRFRSIADNGVKFSLIVNSAHGQPLPSMAKAVHLLKELEERWPDTVLPAFEIRPDHSILDVQSFARTFRHQRCLLVHRNHTFTATSLGRALRPLSRPAVQILLDGGAPLNVVRSIPSAGMVLLRDGFRRCHRNVDYPSRSYFDDLPSTYQSSGFDGFSDFSIVGDTYSPRGGPARHVAIHLTEFATTAIITNHFVSTTPPQQGDVKAKYFTALDLLIFDILAAPPLRPLTLRACANISSPTRIGTFPASEN